MGKYDYIEGLRIRPKDTFPLNVTLYNLNFVLIKAHILIFFKKKRKLTSSQHVTSWQTLSEPIRKLISVFFLLVSRGFNPVSDSKYLLPRLLYPTKCIYFIQCPFPYTHKHLFSNPNPFILQM